MERLTLPPRLYSQVCNTHIVIATDKQRRYFLIRTSPAPITTSIENDRYHKQSTIMLASQLAPLTQAPPQAHSTAMVVGRFVRLSAAMAASSRTMTTGANAA